MAGVINELTSKGYNVIAHVGSSHVENLKKSVETKNALYKIKAQLSPHIPAPQQIYTARKSNPIVENQRSSHSVGRV